MRALLLEATCRSLQRGGGKTNLGDPTLVEVPAMCRPSGREGRRGGPPPSGRRRAGRDLTIPGLGRRRLGPYLPMGGPQPPPPGGGEEGGLLHACASVQPLPATHCCHYTVGLSIHVHDPGGNTSTLPPPTIPASPTRPWWWWTVLFRVGVGGHWTEPFYTTCLLHACLPPRLPACRQPATAGPGKLPPT